VTSSNNGNPTERTRILCAASQPDVAVESRKEKVPPKKKRKKRKRKGIEVTLVGEKGEGGERRRNQSW